MNRLDEHRWPYAGILSNLSNMSYPSSSRACVSDRRHQPRTGQGGQVRQAGRAADRRVACAMCRGADRKVAPQAEVPRSGPRRARSAPFEPWAEPARMAARRFSAGTPLNTGHPAAITALWEYRGSRRVKERASQYLYERSHGCFYWAFPVQVTAYDDLEQLNGATERRTSKTV